jgi:7,8-dihydroneopterin aldolase/epimerase/oxygenase
MAKKGSIENHRRNEEATYDPLDFADTIRIRRIRVLGKHGVTDRERSVLRPLIIDVEVTADLTKAQQSDNIADTVNYSTVHKLIMQIVETHSYRLLESLAGAILDALFEDERVLAARLRIGKPERLDGATPSITLARKNPKR